MGVTGGRLLLRLRGVCAGSKKFVSLLRKLDHSVTGGIRPPELDEHDDMLHPLRLTAICAAIMTPLALVTPQVHAMERQGGAQNAAVPASLTPGQVALIAANDIDVPAMEQLRDALGHPDPSIRAVASRIAAVSKVAGLAPSISVALAGEDTKWVAAEHIRALLLIDTPGARAAIAEHLDRGGLEAVELFLEWMARTSPDRLPSELGRLLTPYGPAAVAHVVPVLGQTFSQPGIGQAVLKELLRITASQESYGRGHSWRAVLEALDADVDEPQAAVLRQALESTNAAIRQETVWALLTRLAREEAVPDAVLAAARPASLSPTACSPQPGTSCGAHGNAQGSPAAATWETFGRELIARRLDSGDRTDHSELLRTAAKNRAADTQAALVLDVLTRRERSVLNDLFDKGRTNRNTSRLMLDNEDRMRSASVRTLPVLWPRLYTTLLGAANCPITERARHGALRVAYASDGRPSNVRIDPGDLPADCQTPLRALARLIVRPATAPTNDWTEWVVVPVSRGFVTCFEQHVPHEIESPQWMAVSGIALAGLSTIEAPAKLHHVNPEYPAAAQRQRIQGLVVIESTISGAGCVASGRIVRSIPALDFSALRAVLDWRFTPTRVDGKPVPVLMTVTVNFALK